MGDKHHILRAKGDKKRHKALLGDGGHTPAESNLLIMSNPVPKNTYILRRSSLKCIYVYYNDFFKFKHFEFFLQLIYYHLAILNNSVRTRLFVSFMMFLMTVKNGYLMLIAHLESE